MTNSCAICTGQASRDYYGPCVDYQTLLGGGGGLKTFSCLPLP